MTNKYIIIFLFILAACADKDPKPNDWCQDGIVDMYCQVGEQCVHTYCKYTVTYCTNCYSIALSRDKHSYDWYKSAWENKFRTPFPYPRRTDTHKVYQPKPELQEFLEHNQKGNRSGRSEQELLELFM